MCYRPLLRELKLRSRGAIKKEASKRREVGLFDGLYSALKASSGRFVSYCAAVRFPDSGAAELLQKVSLLLSHGRWRLANSFAARRRCSSTFACRSPIQSIAQIGYAKALGRFPQPLQVIELASAFGKNVDDEIDVIEQDPIRLVVAFDALWTCP